LFLICGFLVVALVALGGGFLLLQWALLPIDQITRSAEGITSRNLSERLPVPSTGDEFEHLSLALNRMITRLDDAFQHNRRFLADASHELRTPLTILRSELEVMIQRAKTNSDSAFALGNLLEEVERLGQIVEHLFALSRLDAGIAAAPHVHLDLAKLAATTAEQMCLLAEDKDLSITRRTDAPVFVKGDRAQLKQVVVNLLDNAIKYTPNGGAITLTVSQQGHEAVCEVADNGVGIPATAIPHVFDRFFRVDSARSREDGGAGIGLSIVKAICAAHGGRTELESAVGKGSLFRVYFPLVNFANSLTSATHEIKG
jgi:heavy metal sensor kinase